tara:strand:- start:71 stop:517 length:447 start_codon:yes stop_codon:yes gene_type:complete
MFLEIFIKIMTYFDRYRVIYDRIGDEPYLERYYLFLRDRKTFPFNIFIHRFLKSDPDDLHDHPWAFFSIILSGGYWEYTETEKSWRGPLSSRYAPANTFHRVELDKDIPYCWTIFIPFMSTREWGFKTINGWINHEDYFKMKKLEKNK